MLDYENTETRRAFWSILDEAKHRTGFDAASEKVFVQVYPSKSGGCEMYVTKLGMFSKKHQSEAMQEDEGDVRINERSMRGDNGMRKSSYITAAEKDPLSYIQRNKSHAFRFKKMETLLCVCRRLGAAGYRGDSSAYIDDDGCYLMLKSKEDTNFGRPLKADGFVNEYAEELDASAFGIYIGEHGRCICEHDAIETLGML